MRSRSTQCRSDRLTMNPDHRPAHSCRHCERIVLPHKMFIGPNRTLKLPHTGPEVRSALDDGCEIFLPLFGEAANRGSSALMALVEAEYPPPKRFRTICWQVHKSRALRKAQKWGGTFYIDVVKPNHSYGWRLSIRYERFTIPWYAATLKIAPGECSEIHCKDVGTVLTLSRHSRRRTARSLHASSKFIREFRKQSFTGPKVAVNV
jgi:hypothetical protein